MSTPKFAVANGSGESPTALPAGIEEGEDIFDQAIKFAEARKAKAQQVAGSVQVLERPETPTEATTEENSSVVEIPVEVEPETPKPRGLYPDDMPLFSFTFSSGAKVELPLKIDQPPTVWYWENSDLPIVPLTWRWMRWAKVPKSLQRKIVEHHDTHPGEYIDCFNAWMKALNGGATLGE